MATHSMDYSMRLGFRPKVDGKFTETRNRDRKQALTPPGRCLFAVFAGPWASPANRSALSHLAPPRRALPPVPLRPTSPYVDSLCPNRSITSSAGFGWAWLGSAELGWLQLGSVELGWPPLNLVRFYGGGYITMYTRGLGNDSERDIDAHHEMCTALAHKTHPHIAGMHGWTCRFETLQNLMQVVAFTGSPSRLRAQRIFLHSCVYNP